MDIVKFNVEKYKRVLIRFASHLRNFGEIKAAEAIEAVIKSLPIFIIE